MGACGGGLRWQIYSFNAGYNYKNTISTGGLFQLAGRLARYTGNQTYADWADKTWDWMWNSPLMAHDYHIWDGTARGNNCTDATNVDWTYNVGTLLSGAAYMYNHVSLWVQGRDNHRTNVELDRWKTHLGRADQRPPQRLRRLLCPERRKQRTPGQCSSGGVDHGRSRVRVSGPANLQLRSTSLQIFPHPVDGGDDADCAVDGGRDQAPDQGLGPCRGLHLRGPERDGVRAAMVPECVGWVFRGGRANVGIVGFSESFDREGGAAGDGEQGGYEHRES